MYYKQTEGKIGEDAAVYYLHREGYTIICRNFRCIQGEIDIIAKDENYIVFVEVKTRTSTRYGEAMEAVRREQTKAYLPSCRVLSV